MKTITLDLFGSFVMVDDDDYDWLIQWTWHLYNYRGVQYAKRTRRVNEKGPKSVYMHREIAKRNNIPGRTRKANLVDHRNSNGLDDQKINLRWATPRMNRHNCNGCRWQHMVDLIANGQLGIPFSTSHIRSPSGEKTRATTDRGKGHDMERAKAPAARRADRNEASQHCDFGF